MATILRGRNKGKSIKIHQYCNDWITDEDGKVYSITALKYTPKELTDMLKDKNAGLMWSIFEPDLLNGRIIKKKLK